MVLALVVALLVVIGWGAWLAVDVLRARTALEGAASSLAQLERQVQESPDADPAALQRVQSAAAEAVAATSGPHWRLARALPVIGDDARALGEVATVVDDLAVDALPRLAAAARTAAPSRLAPQDGRVDLVALEESRSDVVVADATVSSALERIEGVETATIVGPLRDAVDRLHGQLLDLSATTATAARAVQLLPPMLGADGARDYLVLVQNNAEPRATGGITGSVLHVRAEGGAVALVDQRAGSDLGSFESSIVELSDDERALFGSDLGRYMLNVTSTPDFPRSAEIARSIWEVREGVLVDGVVSIDPVALQRLLEATGPVNAPNPLGGDVVLTGTDAAAYLLNGIYRAHPDPAEQDEVFAVAAQAVFEALSAGQGGAAEAVQALADSAREGRLLVWSAHEAEQDLLTSTVLAGDLTGALERRGGARGEVSPVVGVYLNASSAAKAGYYLDTDISVADVTCRPDGSQAFTLEVTLTSILTADEAATLPRYVVGGDGDGTIRTNLLVYAPRYGGITGSDASTGDPGLFAQRHDGLVVGGRSLALAPGESERFTYQIVSGRNQRGDVSVRKTPGARENSLAVPGSECAENVLS